MTDKPVNRLITDSNELVYKPAESEHVVHLLHDAADPPPVPPIPDNYSIFLRAGPGEAGGSEPLTFDGDPLTFNPGTPAIPVPPPVVGTLYYVSAAGSDGANGLTTGTAWQTIAKVNAAALNAGDAVLFRGGDTFSGTLTPPSSGGSGAPITFGSYGTGKAVINGAAGNLGIFVFNRSYVRFENLIIVGDGAGQGIYAENNQVGNTKLPGVQFVGLEISGFLDGVLIWGATGTSGFTGLTVDGCEVHDNVNRGIVVDGGAGAGTYSHADASVLNSTIYDNGWDGVILGHTDGGLVEFSEAYGNGFSDNNVDGGSVGFWTYESRDVFIQHNESHHNLTLNLDGGGFDIDGGCVDCVVRWNYSHDNEGPGYLVCTYTGSGATTGALVYGNVSENDGNNSASRGSIFVTSPGPNVEAFIVNNTVYNNGDEPLIHLYDPGGSDLSGAVANNILYRDGTNVFVQTSSSNPAGVDLRGNDYFGTGSATLFAWNGTNYTTLAAWRAATGQETEAAANTALTVDPQLVDPGNGGTLGGWDPEALTAYRLPSGSPMSPAGVDAEALFSITLPTEDLWGEPISVLHIGASVESTGAPGGGAEELFFTPETGGGLTFNGETLTFNGEEMSFTPGDGVATPPPPDLPEGLLFDVHGTYTASYLYDLNTYVAGPPPGNIDPFDSPLGGPAADRVYLVDTPVFQEVDEATAAVWTAISDHSISSLVQFAAVEVENVVPVGMEPIDLRLASAEFVSLANDPTEPSRWWDGRVTDPGSIELTLPLVPVDRAKAEIRLGQIRITNTDGLFDTILDTRTVISMPVEIKAGKQGIFVKDFLTICVARITSIAMTLEELTLDISDPATYAQNLFPVTYYGGTGGSDGVGELDGVMKPVVIGTVWNVEPTLVDPVELIYQIHDGAMEAVLGVFDGGVALSFDSNHAGYAGLEAASVPPGEYATCLNAGMIKIGSTPIFSVTAHVNGHALAGTDTRSIATWLMGRLDVILNLDVDFDSFDALPAWPAGWVWREPFTFKEAIDRFVGDAGYHWAGDVSGPITAQRLDPPEDGPLVWALDEADIIDVERAQAPDGFGGPHKRRVIQFHRNWTVQAGALAATAVNKPLRSREWRTVRQTVNVEGLNAIDPPVLTTSLSDRDDAETLADQLLGLHGIPRRFFYVDTKVMFLLPALGSAGTLTHPRLGLGSGAVFRIIAATLDLSESSIRLLVWG